MSTASGRRSRAWGPIARAAVALLVVALAGCRRPATEPSSAASEAVTAPPAPAPAPAAPTPPPGGVAPTATGPRTAPESVAASAPPADSFATGTPLFLVTDRTTRVLRLQLSGLPASHAGLILEQMLPTAAALLGNEALAAGLKQTTPGGRAEEYRTIRNQLLAEGVDLVFAVFEVGPGGEDGPGYVALQISPEARDRVARRLREAGQGGVADWVAGFRPLAERGWMGYAIGTPSHGAMSALRVRSVRTGFEENFPVRPVRLAYEKAGGAPVGPVDVLPQTGGAIPLTVVNLEPSRADRTFAPVLGAMFPGAAPLLAAQGKVQAWAAAVTLFPRLVLHQVHQLPTGEDANRLAATIQGTFNSALELLRPSPKLFVYNNGEAVIDHSDSFVFGLVKGAVSSMLQVGVYGMHVLVRFRAPAFLELFDGGAAQAALRRLDWSALPLGDRFTWLIYAAGAGEYRYDVLGRVAHVRLGQSEGSATTETTADGVVARTFRFRTPDGVLEVRVDRRCRMTISHQPALAMTPPLVLELFDEQRHPIGHVRVGGAAGDHAAELRRSRELVGREAARTTAELAAFRKKQNDLANDTQFEFNQNGRSQKWAELYGRLDSVDMYLERVQAESAARKGSELIGKLDPLVVALPTLQALPVGAPVSPGTPHPLEAKRRERPFAGTWLTPWGGVLTLHQSADGRVGGRVDQFLINGGEVNWGLVVGTVERGEVSFQYFVNYYGECAGTLRPAADGRALEWAAVRRKSTLPLHSTSKPGTWTEGEPRNITPERIRLERIDLGLPAAGWYPDRRCDFQGDWINDANRALNFRLTAGPGGRHEGADATAPFLAFPVGEYLFTAQRRQFNRNAIGEGLLSEDGKQLRFDAAVLQRR